tara:strand:+ start:1767 stop:3119 length:1353 start_codon:yes stop_codon:yes gene_type:complete
MKYFINYHYGGTSTEPIKVNSFGSEIGLVANGIIDHNFFEKKVNFNGLKFKLFSLNIAQMDQFKTMAQHNKIINYIRKEDNLIRTSKFPINGFLDDIGAIVLNKKSEIESEISEESSYESMRQSLSNITINNKSVNDEVINLVKTKYNDYFSRDELSSLEPVLQLGWLKYKERYYSEIPKEEIQKKAEKEDNKNEKLNYENIIKAKERFPNDYYIDISFSKEQPENYFSRIDTVIEFLTNRLTAGEMALFCLQELNPVFNSDNTQVRPELESIFKKYNLIFKFPEEYISHLTGTCSVTLTTENLSHFVSPCSEDLELTTTEHGDKLINNNELIKKVRHKKKILQNFRYKLTYDGKDLDVYNLHTNMFSYNKAYDKLNEIVNHLKDDNFILVGDMNLEMDYRIIHRVTKLFRDNRIALDLIQTPEVDYQKYRNPNNPTYDIFSAKGIDIVF